MPAAADRDDGTSTLSGGSATGAVRPSSAKTEEVTMTSKKKSAPSTEEYAVAPEADFDDTIAKNRALPLVDAGAVPAVPRGFRPTDPDTRNRRLRKLAAEHRAETRDALREAAARDLKGDLGKHAPDPTRAPALLEKITATGELVAATQALASYAREVDQIALSDALLFLEAEQREIAHAIEHEPGLAQRYPALRILFAARAAAISDGIARSRTDAAPDGNGEKKAAPAAVSGP